ncbi:hypothetical protein [Paenibacillus brevis]|uniref:Uncharacterized protein n=1 Tax=Paenibacillus brevis TaxID=2841508 RepID=A0ABS6FPI4_9BACL|nr:hypothetical protein [Paenibacillus brevis]MBU5671402.1 hypothetical protein [Paenibacillus brevis]
MKKKNVLKKILLMSMAIALFSILVACGSGSKVAGTYSMSIGAEELAGNSWHNGFVTGTGLTQQNTLKLDEEGGYEYTKLVTKFDEAGNPVQDEKAPKITYTFTGEYTSVGNTVTLTPPTEVVFDEHWGTIDEGGYISSSSGKASAGDKVVPKEEEAHDPMSVFPTPFYLQSSSHSDNVIVTVNKDASSFVYEEGVSSEDE